MAYVAADPTYYVLIVMLEEKYQGSYYAKHYNRNNPLFAPTFLTKSLLFLPLRFTTHIIFISLHTNKS